MQVQSHQQQYKQMNVQFNDASQYLFIDGVSCFHRLGCVFLANATRKNLWMKCLANGKCVCVPFYFYTFVSETTCCYQLLSWFDVTVCPTFIEIVSTSLNLRFITDFCVKTKQKKTNASEGDFLLIRVKINLKQRTRLPLLLLHSVANKPQQMCFLLIGA